MYAKAEMINNETTDITTNNLKMRKYKRFCSVAYTVYAIMFIVYVLIIGLNNRSLYNNPNSFLITFDALVIKTGVFFFAMMAIFKKNNNYAIIGSIIQVGSFIISLASEFGTNLSGGKGPNLSFTLCYIALILMVVKNNRIYDYLKEQYGFPHFNERQATQDFNKRQREIKDEFQINFERRKKTSTNEMGDISKEIPVNNATSDYNCNNTEMDSL